MAITNYVDFANDYLVKNGMIGNAANINKAPDQLKKEIDILNAGKADTTVVDGKVSKVTSTDNAIVRFDGTTGAVQNSGVTIDDNNNITQRASLYKRDDGVSVASIDASAGTALYFNDYTGGGYRFYTSSVERMRIDSNGNVGIGITPSATGVPTIEGQYLISSGHQENYMLQNAVHAADGTYRYVQPYLNGASNYRQVDGNHIWGTAPRGTAGNLIAWTNVMTLDASGNLLLTSGTGGIGYGTGAGGTVTQLTSKSTSVTLNKPTGQITMNNAALASSAKVEFALYSNLISAGDLVCVNITGGASEPRSYRIESINTATGGVYIRLTNLSGGSLSEAVEVAFAIIKGAIA